MSTNKMASSEKEVEEVVTVSGFRPENGRLDKNQRLRLIEFYSRNPVLWDTSIKLSRKSFQEQRDDAMSKLEEAFSCCNFSSAELVAVWKSLRASMLREVKKENESDDYRSQWKFYKPMLFIKPALDRLNNRAAEWSDQERRAVINFFQQHPPLWNHKLKDYHDKQRRQVRFMTKNII